MIAQRLKPIGWVAAVAFVALCCYLLSLRVAAERNALESVNMQILSAKRDIRRLQTEFGTRANLAQLERWNGQVLALSAPGATQYVGSQHQLIAMVTPAAPMHAEVQLAKADVTPATPAEPSFRRAVVTEESEAPQRPQRPMLQSVAYQAPAERVALLDSGTLGDIARRAAREAGDAVR